MAKFSIDGYIGGGLYSKGYVKSMLEGNESKDVTILVNSLGGDYNHALNIKAQLERHGKVTVDFYGGFNASSATVIALGAKHVRINKYSFYLIHKVSEWVDKWGYMNEDELATAIKELEKVKNENEKITLQLASMYSDKSGKSVKDILALMKEEKWLTAEEAKEWGFVDEVYVNESKENGVRQLNMHATKIASLGFPTPNMRSFEEPPETPMKMDSIVTQFSNVVEQLGALFPSKNNKEKHMKDFERVNGVLKVNTLVSADGKGVYLTEEQLRKLDAHLGTIEEERNTAKTGRENLLSKLNKIDSSVEKAKDDSEKINAVRNLLAKQPGKQNQGTQGKGDDGGGDSEEDWGVINNLAHNQKVDELI